MLKRWLAHPLTRGLEIDDPQTTDLRRRIIREKPFLRRIYQEWYGEIVAALPAGHEPVLELGAGAGFLRDYLPGVITSEIFPCPGVNIVLDGLALPFADRVLRGIVLVDVLHHLPRPRQFFIEAARCVRTGGAVVMIEPWVTAWSELIYTKLHHEPFQPRARAWEFPASGPLSGANGALPWILFERDRAQFEREFPTWKIQKIELAMPFRYLVSGGVSMRGLMPGWSFTFWRGMEQALRPWMRSLAMFAYITLKRCETD
ncbi:MAG: methyltransferase domain-containing protein [Acidobacteria bacterium]|nr:methyltransferase domain-containing protein [Acidobacteriota bacterium]MBI3426357.1 methyltransferase domain-containing protein [Acidobacteriota bacterium]